MMLYPPLSKLLEHADSRYLLVNMIAHRARQISAQAEKDEIPLDEKAVSIAIKEIADGAVEMPCHVEAENSPEDTEDENSSAV